MERFVTKVAAVAVGTDKTLINLFNPNASPTTRGRIYEVIVGSKDTPADNAGEFLIQRTTAVGTEGSGFVPHNLDPDGPAGAYDSGLGVFTVEPTYTASAYLLPIPMNQRTTFHWRAFPGDELVLPATQNAGAGLKSASNTGTDDFEGVIYFKE